MVIQYREKYPCYKRCHVRPKPARYQRWGWESCPLIKNTDKEYLVPFFFHQIPRKSAERILPTSKNEKNRTERILSASAKPNPFFKLLSHEKSTDLRKLLRQNKIIFGSFITTTINPTADFFPYMHFRCQEQHNHISLGSNSNCSFLVSALNLILILERQE